MSFFEKDNPSCPICNYVMVKEVVYNGQKMCHQCKKAIKLDKPTRKYEGKRE